MGENLDESLSDSIEHISPQSAAVPGEQVHRLGNLVLLPPKVNYALKDLKPIEKREAYMNTGLAIAQEVASKLTRPWNRRAIDEREEMLLGWAATEWA